jgi:hypothetical protein
LVSIDSSKSYHDNGCPRYENIASNSS